MKLKDSLWDIQGLDPCLDGNHRNLTNSESRSTDYTVPEGQTACCDRRMDEAWYRVISQNGGDMPTSCAAVNSCGTLYPIWMNGK